MIHDEGLGKVAETFGCSLCHRTQVLLNIIHFSPTNIVKGRANPSTGSGYKDHTAGLGPVLAALWQCYLEYCLFQVLVEPDLDSAFVFKQ